LNLDILTGLSCDVSALLSLDDLFSDIRSTTELENACKEKTDVTKKCVSDFFSYFMARTRYVLMR
jgi:hypothetical protein